MKRNVFFILLCVLLGTAAFAQDGKALTASDPLLQKITAVKELAVKIDDAKKKVDASATASRAAAQEANEALAALYKEYQAELEKQIGLNKDDKAVRSALEKELESIKAKDAPSKSTR